MRGSCKSMASALTQLRLLLKQHASSVGTSCLQHTSPAEPGDTQLAACCCAACCACSSMLLPTRQLLVHAAALKATVLAPQTAHAHQKSQQPKTTTDQTRYNSHKAATRKQGRMYRSSTTNLLQPCEQTTAACSSSSGSTFLTHSDRTHCIYST